MKLDYVKLTTTTKTNQLIQTLVLSDNPRFCQTNNNKNNQHSQVHIELEKELGSMIPRVLNWEKEEPIL